MQNKMNYELAKELKEAEFPHSENWVDECDCFQDDVGYAGREVPTLSELIEECGDKLFSLTRHGKIWQTNFKDGMAGETAGKTLEEAVARLWLALNKKR